MRAQARASRLAHELDEALGLAGEHLSLYQLTIEPGTAFATLARQGNLVPCPTTTPQRHCSR